MDIEKLKVKDLLQLLSPNSEVRKELVKRGVLRTKNIVGEIGEYYVQEIFNKTSGLPNLFLPPPGVKNIDLIGRDGERYSVKTVSSRSGTTGSFWDPISIKKNEKKFEYLLIVILDDNYDLDLILSLTWDDFFKFKSYNKRMNNFNISVTKELIKSVKIVYEK